MTRVGLGYDIHLLKSGEELILGGVTIPSRLGTVGHSDADPLLHAIIDALLGAAGLGDIGDHFPPSDEAYRGVSSRLLLQKTAALIARHGFTIVNLDTIVILQEPSLAPFKQSIRAAIAEVLHMSSEDIGIKAKTKEGVDAAGERRAVEAHAVALLDGTDV
jgi:2-C-methyl-D-erythritol 2,4-cyclodiphosphate synthase